MIQRYAIDGPAVIVPARIALLLERHYRMERLRLEVRGRDAELDGVLAAWHAAAMQWSPGSDAGSDAGTEMAGGSEPAGQSDPVDPISASEVARSCGVSPRAVTKAASEGRLRGRLVAGRWTFHPDDVAAWVAVRAA